MSDCKKRYSYWNIFLSTLAGDIVFAILTIMAVNTVISNHDALGWLGAVTWIVLGKIITGQARDMRIDMEIERAFRVRNLDKDDYED